MNTLHATVSDLCDGFLHQLSTQPDAPAVISRDGVTKYHALGGMTAAAQEIISAARPRTVGLYFNPSAPLVAAAWASLCSGVAYVPLAPTYPEERIRYMLDSGGVDLVLTSAEERTAIADILAGTGAAIEAVSAGHGIDAAPYCAADADAIAYVLYTSGSTGAPKGVEITHAALGHQLRWIGSGLELGPHSRILHKTPISFDASQWELLANATGAAVVVGDADLYRDPQALVDTVIGHEVTHLQAVPTLLQALCEEPRFPDCTSLRLLASGGEALPTRLAASAAALLPSASLVNLYGPTETTINAAHHTVRAPTATQGGTVPIGLPVPGTGFHLLDGDGEPSASATIGELAISGRQLARGYRNRPEETDRRFVTRHIDGIPTRLYRTGDVVELADGLYHFRGRADSQVKIRGHRIELDEIRTVLENHDWVRHAGVCTVRRDETATPRLVGHVELNPHEAALMDQGVHRAHHQSKATRTQVKAQIAGLGVRADFTAAGIDLPISPDDHKLLRQLAFARKTYRTFHSTTSDTRQLAQLASLVHNPRELHARYDGGWTVDSLAFVLRSLVQYASDSRLLPKYAYASPGALYGVQVYVRITGLAAIANGMYYLNPATATLHLVHSVLTEEHVPAVEVVLIGQRSVITSVYQTNVDEVLRFESGHLLGVLDTVAPAAGKRVGHRNDTAVAPALIGPDTTDRFLIGAWPLRAADQADSLTSVHSRLELFTGDVESRGLHEPAGGDLTQVSRNSLIRRKDVIAINQRVYDQASFGLILTSDGTADSYLDLGRALQRAEMNDYGLGLMSSGYSSCTGRDLATARRIRAFTGADAESSYFALGGPITAEQIAHDGMDEDALHTQGPAEIITADIAEMLPHYMVPDIIRITDELPRTPNGKIDTRALHDAELARADHVDEATYVGPGSLIEHQLARLWRDVLRLDGPVSTVSSFFSLGGNSISAVRLVKTIRDRFGVKLPVQAIFEQDTIVKQARALAAGSTADLSRAVPLAGSGNQPVFLWPGLGGYPMNLRPLAEAMAGTSFRCYGLQAHGLNESEEMDESIAAMAGRDLEQIRRIQPHGPYNLVGYSFGSRVAFEVAHQLEASGESVDRVILLAPGSPHLQREPDTLGAAGRYADSRFKRVLFSVFFGRTRGPLADSVAATVRDRSGFLDAIRPELEIDTALAERITRIVEKTYSFEYTFTELVERNISATITIARARGDDYSFLDAAASDIPHIGTTLDSDHYQILHPPQVKNTADTVVEALTRPTITGKPKEKSRMPHVAIKHFPASVSDDKMTTFVEQLSSLVCNTFDVPDSAVSISLESIHQDDWNSNVYQPEIVHRKQFLVKAPQY